MQGSHGRSLHLLYAAGRNGLTSPRDRNFNIKVTGMQKKLRPRTAPRSPQEPGRETPAQRSITLSIPLFIVVLALVFVCGLLAGSMLAARQGQPVHQISRPAPAAAPAPATAATSAQAQRISELEALLAKKTARRPDLVELGHLYFDTQRPQDAIRAYEAALAIDGRDADVLTDCGVMYRAAGQYEKALDCFARARQVAPGHIVSLFNEGVVLNYDLHRHDEALKRWRELASREPGFRTPDGRTIEDHIRMTESGLAGEQHAASQNTDAPVPVVPPAPAPAPVPVPAAPQATAPQISPARQQQIRELEAAVLKNPGDRNRLVALGNLYFDTGVYQSAIASYEAALAIDGRDAGVLTDCGVMYRAAGQYAKALDCFARALQVHPDHPVALFNRGVVLNFDLHRHDEALQIWRELAASHPDFQLPDGRPLADLIRQMESDASH